MSTVTVRKIILFVLIGLGLAYALHRIGETLSPIHGQHKARMQMLMEKADKIEALAVGHSHNLALDFEALGLNGFHLWIIGSDMFEVRYILNSILPSLPNLQMVFIPVTHHTFLHNNGLVGEGIVIRHVYYATTPTLKSFRPIHNDFKYLIMGKVCSIARHDHWKGVLKAALNMIRGNGAYDSFMADVSATGKIGPPFENDMVGCERTKRFDELQEYMRLSKSVLEEQPETPETVFAAMQETVRLLQQNEIRPIFYTTPVAPAYRDYVYREAPKTMQLTQSYLDRLQNEFGIEYYDFFRDSSLVNHPKYFYDEDHLDQPSQIVLTDLLANCFRKS